MARVLTSAFGFVHAEASTAMRLRAGNLSLAIVLLLLLLCNSRAIASPFDADDPTDSPKLRLELGLHSAADVAPATERINARLQEIDIVMKSHRVSTLASRQHKPSPLGIASTSKLLVSKPATATPQGSPPPLPCHRRDAESAAL